MAVNGELQPQRGRQRRRPPRRSRARAATARGRPGAASRAAAGTTAPAAACAGRRARARYRRRLSRRSRRHARAAPVVGSHSMLGLNGLTTRSNGAHPDEVTVLLRRNDRRRSSMFCVPASDGFWTTSSARGADQGVGAGLLDRPLEALAQLDLRLPAEQLARERDVGLADLRVVGRQRLDRRSRDFEPVTSITASASSSSVNSFGLPMFTGSWWPDSASAMIPRIRSST